MTTWVNSQFPRPDFHRQVQRHYWLQFSLRPRFCSFVSGKADLPLMTRPDSIHPPAAAHDHAGAEAIAHENRRSLRPAAGHLAGRPRGDRRDRGRSDATAARGLSTWGLRLRKMFTAVVWRPSPNETNRNESGRDQRAVKANFAACQGHGASRTSRQNAGTASHAD